MKTKQIVIFSIIAITIIGLISLSGCVTQKTYTIPHTNGTTITTTTSNGNSYSTTTGITLTDQRAKQLDETFRPVLTKVFGGAKPTSVINAKGGISVVYILPKKATQGDYNKLVTEVKNIGFNITMQSTTSESYGFIAISNTTSYLFGGNYGKDKISISAMQMQS